MGAYLADVQTDQDNQDINDFLDEAIGEPTGLAGSGGLGGADSWFAPIASDQTIDGEIVKMWFGKSYNSAIITLYCPIFSRKLFLKYTVCRFRLNYLLKQINKKIHYRAGPISLAKYRREKTYAISRFLAF